MIYSLAMVLVILWLLGVVTGNTAGSYIHIILIFALLLAIANFVSGRNSRS